MYLSGGDCFALSVAFALVTLLVTRGASVRIDDTLLRWAQAHLLPHLSWFWEAISWPGYTRQMIGVSVIFLALAWYYGQRRGVVVMLFALLAWPISALIKQLVDRPRPTPEQAQVVGPLSASASYPSGHVVTYTVVCGLLILLVRDALPIGQGERRRDGTICGILAALILLVGPARVALGHHWPIDVFGAYLLGGALLTLVARWRHAASPLSSASEASE